MRKKLLLVDDSPTVLLMERLLLQNEPYELFTASHGEEALKLARAEQPDLILLDVMMPDLDGLEVCQRLRAEEATREVPIILVTVRGAAEQVARGYESGCTAYVSKPFDGNELRSMIARLLGTH